MESDCSVDRFRLIVGRFKGIIIIDIEVKLFLLDKQMPLTQRVVL